MKLYLVRHGQALAENQDPLQHLSEKGNLDAQKAAEFLKKARIKINIIISSIKTRAIQTAEIIAAEVCPTCKVEQINGVLPNDSAEAFLESIEFSEKDIMLVGHLPFLSHLTSLLLSGEKNRVKILYSTCSVVCLEQKEGNAWQLIFAINPDLL
ncbi:MAG: phosphohistidine phosphatase SixA [Candidatus Omnitrophica bacterium]|nr:phosphohistidine phosphatase SixA [Candidatus Omnitrophota bacterium]